MPELAELVPLLEQKIRDGHLGEVQKILNNVNFTKVPRKQLAKLLNIAYRANMPYLSIRVINHLRSEDNVNHAEPEPDELIEYAAALIRVGATSDALSTLTQIDTQKYPKALLYQAFSCITEWKYVDAIPYLEAYLPLCHGMYAKLVAYINLAAAYTNCERWDDAEKLLNQIWKSTNAKEANLIYTNSLELGAQLAINRKQFGLARQYLQDANQITASKESIYELFKQKWHTIIDFFEHGPTEANLNHLQVVHTKAKELKHWETVRECDFYRSFFLQDEMLFVNVYFGTPFEAYRKQMLRRFDGSFSIPNTFDWSLYLGKPSRTFDCVTSMESEKVFLKKDKVPARLLRLLLRDFYRPARIGFLHRSLFPEDRFEGHYSVMKVQQAVKRLRAWLVENQIPVNVECIDGGYKLVLTGAYGFRISLKDLIPGADDLYLYRLNKHFGVAEFYCVDAARVSRVSKRQMNYLIKSDKGESIEKIGIGPNTRYKFKKVV